MTGCSKILKKIPKASKLTVLISRDFFKDVDYKLR